VCPHLLLFVVLIDAAMKKLFNRDFDDDGRIARSGVVCNQLLNEWLKNPYYNRSPPKTTGREVKRFDRGC
jgi:anhydro-N-acetylmuramic acid kinase